MDNATVETRVEDIMGRAGRKGLLLDGTVYMDQNMKLGKRMMELEADARKLAGHPIRMGSRKDMAVLLFEQFGLPETAKRSVSKAALAHHTHPILPIYHEWGTVSRTLSLMKKVPDYVENGRLKTIWHTSNDTSGQIYCSDFNVQQLPLLGRLALVADPNTQWILGDYKQNELRCLAALSGSRDLMKVLDGEDAHKATIALMLGKPLSDVTDREREWGKVFNYGIVYGMDERGIATRLGITEEEAQEKWYQYFAAFPDVQFWIEEVKARAKREKFVENPFGHRRELPDWTDEAKTGRQAVNTMVQGSAASLLKRSIIRVHQEFPVAVSVHDSIGTVSPESPERFRELMETDWNGVHFPADVASGISWGHCMQALHNDEPDEEELPA